MEALLSSTVPNHVVRKAFAKHFGPPKTPAQRRHDRDLRLRRQYGITLRQYNRMLRAQSGVCAICGTPPKVVPLNVDHDHKTKRIRGLLCHMCNRDLHHKFENPIILRKAAAYLERTKAWGL